jgi:hypothetical protein
MLASLRFLSLLDNTYVEKVPSDSYQSTNRQNFHYAVCLRAMTDCEKAKEQAKARLGVDRRALDFYCLRLDLAN